ncbi:hypothetical protein DL765_010797 [Monosporascus sp. GIB2]|nr:hypothetical protein DL765_010797 [Monosporascus sp. GIB2]
MDGSYPGGNPSLWEEIASVTATVKNTGNVTGAQVVQLYVSLPQEGVPSNTPVQVLRGFEKVVLNPTVQACQSLDYAPGPEFLEHDRAGLGNPSWND